MTTGINYLDETWNPITGCSGKGCKAHCWAREMVRRFPDIHGTENEWDWLDPCPIPFGKVQFHPDRLDKPLHWRKPRHVGVAFMGDLFDLNVPGQWIKQVYGIIARAYWHKFFLLTKQPQNIPRDIDYSAYTPNAWHGVSITDQEDADRMIPELLKVPGKRWVSIEPMLGPVDLEGLLSWACPQCNSLNNQIIWPCPYCKGDRYKQIDWIVLGCESGPKRRPCPHEWMIDIVRQCKAAGVLVWVKQVEVNGKVSHRIEEWPEELRRRGTDK